MGGDPGRLYKTSANTAEFSRKIAKKLYGTEERPYGYVFGGSGGSFKTMGCMEATEGIWDGAVPYVMANPMAAPNVFASRMRAVRLLGEAGMQRVVEAMEPGGSGDIYEGLDALQEQALREQREWDSRRSLGLIILIWVDGALMVLVTDLFISFSLLISKISGKRKGMKGQIRTVVSTVTECSISLK